MSRIYFARRITYVLEGISGQSQLHLCTQSSDILVVTWISENSILHETRYIDREK